MLSYTEQISRRIPLEQLIPLPMPLGLCIEPVNVCNYKCSFCPTSLPEFANIVGDVGIMDMGLYGKIIRDIKAMGKLKKLNLYGDGEPLMNKNIAEMVRIAIEQDVAYPISITTNASLLTEKMAEEIVKSGLHYIRISICSIYEDRNRLLTGSEINVTKIYDNVKRLKRIRDEMKNSTPYIYVKMIDTYSEENKDFMKMYEGIADQVNIETPMNWNGFNNFDFISKIDPERRTNEFLIQGFYEQKGNAGVKKICTTAFHSLNIKLNGDVVICIVDWNKGTKVGNIKERSLSEIWFGEKLREFRKMHIEERMRENESCKNCRYLYCNPDIIDQVPREKLFKIIGCI